MHTTTKLAYVAPRVRLLGGFVARTLGIGGNDLEAGGSMTATTTSSQFDDKTNGVDSD